MIDEKDLYFILEKARSSVMTLQNSHIFITGGTGFIGKWIISFFHFAKIKASVLTRDPDIFLKNNGQFKSSPYISFEKGDITNFSSNQNDFDYIIHGATQASLELNIHKPMLMLNTIIQGMEKILDFSQKNSIKNFLHLSSGAIYGKIPSYIDNVEENYMGAPDSMNRTSAYGNGKRIAEFMGTLSQTPVSHARCFAFCGPYLPLDTHFAIGNFIYSGLKNEDIHIKGDGTPLRSYMYAADLIVHLLKLLVEGKDNQAYNVGSDQAISIKELAIRVQRFFPKIKVNINTDSKAINIRPDRYVPNINKVKNELNLDIYHNLDEQIEKTISFYKERI